MKRVTATHSLHARIPSLLIAIFLLCCSLPSRAGEPDKRVKLLLGADLVSGYVSRGFYNAGASIQPTLGFTVSGFRLDAWGSLDFAATSYKEVNLNASYSFHGLTVMLTDFYWTGTTEAVTPDSPIPDRNYFDFGRNTPHRLEASLHYTFAKFPLTLEWHTMILGHDRKPSGKRAYSSYFLATYAHTFDSSGVKLEAWTGLTPWETWGICGTRGFAVCNVGIGVTKTLRISKYFPLPFFVKSYWNPATEDVHLVAGLSIWLGD